MRRALLASACFGLVAGCRPAPFTAELPTVPGAEALLFASSRTESDRTLVTITAHDVTEDTPRPVVLAADSAVPEGVEHDFVAAWLPGSLASNGLLAGEVHPLEGPAKRAFAEVARGARFFRAQTVGDASMASFAEISALPSRLLELPISVRTRCLGFDRGRVIAAPTRGAPSFAVPLDDGGAVVGFRAIADDEPRMFHLSDTAELREIDLTEKPRFQVAKRSTDGFIWLLAPGLELWRADEVRATTATASVLVGLERVFTPAEVPAYPAECPEGAAPRPGQRPRVVSDFAIRSQGRTVTAFYAMDQDGAFLVREGARMRCAYRASVRSLDVRVFVLAPDEDSALFSADSDPLAYRYRDARVEPLEIFGPEVFVASLSRQPSFGVVATTSGKIARLGEDERWSIHQTSEVTRPVAVLEVPHPWAAESGLFIAGDFGKVAEWWPGEPRVCPDRLEALAPSGIKLLVPLGDGALFVAQAPPGATGTVVMIWVRPEDYPSP